MNATERNEHLTRHIPYRMTAVDGLQWVCDRLIGGDLPHSIDVNSQRGVIKDHIGFTLTNALVDAGLIHTRGLLSLLGIGINPKTLRLKPETTRWNGDVTMEQLGARSIAVGEACTSASAKSYELEAVFESIIATVHKGVAHHTSGSPIMPTINQYRMGAVQTLALIEHHLYATLGMGVPAYRIWTEAIQLPRSG